MSVKNFLICINRLLFLDLTTAFRRRHPTFLYWYPENGQMLNRYFHHIISLTCFCTKSECCWNHAYEEQLTYRHFRILTLNIRDKLLPMWTNSPPPNDWPNSSNKAQWTTKVQNFCVPDTPWLTQTHSLPFSNMV